jgi:hypothetical protein
MKHIHLVFLSLLVLWGCTTGNNPTYTLTTTVSPAGSGSISPTQTTFNKGDVVILQANPQSGWKFVRWEGDINKTANPLNFEMSRNLNLMAIFEGAGVSDTVLNFPSVGLVGWWPFNGNANDMSGSGNNGIIHGGVASTTDRFGSINSAYLFDGNGGYIAVPTLDTLKYSPITYSAWVIVNSYFPSSRVHKFRSIIGRNTAFISDNGVIGFYANSNSADGTYDNTFLMWRGGGNDGGVPYSKKVPSLNIWTHVVYTQEKSGNWKWYQDGVLVNSGSFTNSQADFKFFRIGGSNNQSNGNTYWNDKLDDIGVWNRVLTQEEITYLFQLDN